MRRIFKFLFCALIIITVITITTVLASAQGIALHTAGKNENKLSENKISYGLDVMANRCKIEFAGISGAPLYFSEEKFACAMNLSQVNEIEISSLPLSECGVLYFGTSPVVCGQTISKNSIELLSYEMNTSVDSDILPTFEIKVNGSDYKIECNLFMLDNINASPTLSGVPTISLNIETYRGVSAKGVLGGYDPEGDDLTYEIVSYAENGCVTIIDRNRGEYVYSPMSNYTGQDSFTYVVKDTYGNYSASATVSVRVSSPYSDIVYSDMTDSDEYNYALDMTEKNVMNGEKVGDYYYFRPNIEVSRVDFIVSAMKVLGIDSLPDVEKTVFADDDEIGSEVKGYVALAYSKEYISGINDKGQLYFKPDEPITLSEAAVVLSNMIGYCEHETAPAFANSEDIPVWSKQAVMSLRALGIIELPCDAVFENVNISRSQMAKLLSRAAWVSEAL